MPSTYPSSTSCVNLLERASHKEIRGSLSSARVGTVGDHNKHQVGGGICKSWDIKVTIHVRERCHVPNNGTQQLASVENKAVFEAK